jgi:hypothetical protein
MKRLMLIAALGCAATLHGADDDTAFFEAKILPVLQKRCFECHSHENKIKGGLALDSRNGWEHGGDNGPALVPGSPDKSLLIKAVRYTDENFEMPPKGKLPRQEIALLEAWIKQGAADPRVSKTAKTRKTIDLTEGRKFWAFQPVSNPKPPAVKDAAWALDPLDRFVLAQQERASIHPTVDADRYTWLRRVSLDLSGLPPTPAEIQQFVKDNAPDACEKVVDRLLASKAYGERWARHWLDLTGYADMMGTSNSVFAEHAWRYRDYVIASLNADKPFDEFVREQIAGDLMPAKSIEDRAENLVATGFLMVGDVEIVNPDKAKMEADHIDSQVTKIGQTFLGMTLGCVRCHDHKFDPVGLEDYYGIAGMLRSSPSAHKMPDMGVWSTLNTTVLPETPAQLEVRKKLEAENQQRIADLKAQQTKLTEEKAAIIKQLAALETPSARAPVAAATSQPPTDNAQREPAASTSTPAAVTPPAQAHPGKPASETAAGVQPAPDKEALTKRRDEIDAQLKKLPGDVRHAEFFHDKTPRAFAMGDGKEPSDMPVYIRGNPYAPGALVPRGTLRVASWDRLPEIPAAQSGRLQLAEWLADKRNPLTARVAVNRIWQKLFSDGIVRSVDYFGERGEKPTHPELLDHLATRFMSGGWSQKKLLRSLVLSRTYRLSSANDTVAAKVDPENKLFWRMNRQRLDAEAIRDSILAISGELIRNSGGPALVLENPENCGALALKGVNPPNYAHKVPRPSQEFERTIYLPVFRNGFAGPDRVRNFFDFVNPAQISGQRPQTVVPTQALFLLNNELLRKRAGALAKSLAQDFRERDARLAELWLRVMNRPAAPEEHSDAVAFLSKLTPLVNDRPASDALAWHELCHTLLASNHFLFRL